MAQSTDPIGSYKRADILGLLDEFSDILVRKMAEAEERGGDFSTASRGSRQVSHASLGTVVEDEDGNLKQAGGVAGGGVLLKRPNSEVSAGASSNIDRTKSEAEIEAIVQTHAKPRGLSIADSDSMDAKRRWVKHWERQQNSEAGLLPTYFGGNVNWQQAATGAANIGDYLQGGGQGFNAFGKKFGAWGGLNEGSLMHTAAGGMSRAGLWAEDNALAIDAVRHFGQKLAAESNKLTGYGQSLGAVEGSGLGSSVGNVRPPFLSPGARKGAQATFDSLLSGFMTPGLSPKEDLQIKGSLSSMGWYDGTEEADEILGKGYGDNKGGLRELFSYDPRLNNDLTMQQMDQTVRYGTPIEQFVETMKKADMAAKGANASLEQMQSAMSTMGDQAVASGGKMINGMNNAIQWAAATGTNPEVGAALQENSYVQGRTYRDTGVIPQMQGALNSGVKTQSTLNAINEMWGNVGSFPQRVIRDDQGNVLQVLDGKDQKAAMVGEALGIDAQAVQRLRDRGLWGKFKNGLNVESLGQGAVDSFQTGNKAMKNDNMSAYRRWTRQGTKSVKSGIRAMGNAVDQEGEKLYDDDEIEAVRTAGSAIKGLDLSEGDLNITDGEAGSVASWLENAGFKAERGDLSDKEFVRKMMEKNPRLKAKYRREHQAEALQKAETKATKEAQEGKDQSGGDNIIELGPQAKRYFQLVDPAYAAQMRANAGGAATNVPNSQQN
jgi:hypothetical protein